MIDPVFIAYAPAFGVVFAFGITAGVVIGWKACVRYHSRKPSDLTPHELDECARAMRRRRVHASEFYNQVFNAGVRTAQIASLN